MPQDRCEPTAAAHSIHFNNAVFVLQMRCTHVVKYVSLHVHVSPTVYHRTFQKMFGTALHCYDNLFVPYYKELRHCSGTAAHFSSIFSRTYTGAVTAAVYIVVVALHCTYACLYCITPAVTSTLCIWQPMGKLNAHIN
jgi:hypothetical protein